MVPHMQQGHGQDRAGGQRGGAGCSAGGEGSCGIEAKGTECVPPLRYYIFAEAEKAGYFVKTTTNTDFEG